MNAFNDFISRSVKSAAISEPVRWFFNKFYYFTHNKSMRHNKRLWPYVKVWRNSESVIERIVVRPGNREVPLTSFEKVPRAKGKNVHLILSGPSINEIDYDQLNLPCVMGVNGAIALQQRSNITFQYYTIIDASFVRNRTALVEKIVSQDLVLFARVEVLRAITLRISPTAIKCRFVAFDEVGTPALAAKPSSKVLCDMAKRNPEWQIFDSKRYRGFSFDPRKDLFPAKTVAYDALQILVWLGFMNIYIHGLDLNNVNSVPRFYENKEDNQSSNIDVNFANFIEPSFRSAGQLLRERGVNVYNLSPQSALDEDVFPKRRWIELVE